MPTRVQFFTGVGLLVAIVLSVGAQQTPYSIDKHRGVAKKKRYSPSSPPAIDYRNGTSNWPYGPHYNFPYPDRPYGDPGHGGE